MHLRFSISNRSMAHILKAKSYRKWDHISSPALSLNSIRRYCSLNFPSKFNGTLGKVTCTSVARCTVLLSLSCIFIASTYCWLPSRERRQMFFRHPWVNWNWPWLSKPITAAETTNKLGLYSLFVSLSSKSGFKPCSPLPLRDSTELCYLPVLARRSTGRWRFPMPCWFLGLRQEYGSFNTGVAFATGS